MNDYNLSDIEVYENQIEYYSREYIETLTDPSDIYNSSVFTGMVKYIYRKVFMPTKKRVSVNRNSNKSIVNYDDIELLDSLFNIYTELCYRYKKRPTILNYSLMVGLDNITINSWKNGKYRNSSPIYRETVKKWFSECESALYDGAIENNSIGCIFALKANYGYSDNMPQKLIVENSNGSVTAEAIAEKYKAATLPEKPIIEE